MRHRFNVFGRILSIERTEGGNWRCHSISPDGKRTPVSLAFPDELKANELGQYLYDIYHELATPTNGDVFEITQEQ